MGETRIYLDTEYCFPGMSETSGRPSEHNKRQIVQIAAIKYVVGEAVEVSSFDQLVIPAYVKTLPKFFEELTAITQADVETNAISFPEAIQNFREFCGNLPIWTFEKDQEVIEQNLEYYNLASPFDDDFIRVSDLLNGWGIDRSKYSSGTLYQAVDLDMDGHVHNALHDVRSMAAAIDILQK